MRIIALFIAIQLVVALRPILNVSQHHMTQPSTFPGWPQTFEGLNLNEVGLRTEEKKWLQDFPGEVNRFTAGEREILIRYVSKATRMLHPSSDCLKAQGYKVVPKRVRRDNFGNLWNCVEANRVSTQPFTVCERIYDETGRSWSDTSNWYWQALLDGDGRGYFAISVRDTA